MNTFTFLKNSLIVVLFLSFVFLSNLAFSQQTTTEYVDFEYNSSSTAIEEISFIVKLNDVEIDPNAVHEVNGANSWLLGADDYDYHIEPANGSEKKWKVTFTLNDTSKTGSGHVAEIGFGLMIVTEENFKNGGDFIEVIDVEAKFKAFDATLYPNPATNQVHWNANVTEGTTVQLIHTNGKVENVTCQAGMAIDVSHLPRGFYIVRFANQGQIVTQKLVLR